jgi:hypothetical protein
MVVVRGFQRFIGLGQTIGIGLDGRSHGIQQSVELSLAHLARQVRARRDFDYNDCSGSRAHRNFPQNYRRAIAGYDRVFLIAAKGQETGSFSTKLWLQSDDLRGRSAPATEVSYKSQVRTNRNGLTGLQSV